MNVLVLGTGSAGRKHIKALKRIEPTTSIYALRHNQGHSAAKIPGVRDIYDLSAFPVSERSFAIIANPTHVHITSIKKLIPLGIPLFIEKPLSHSLMDTAEVAQKIRAGGIKTYIACNLRFHPVICHLRTRLSDCSDAINEVNVYCGSYLPHWRKGMDYRQSYSAQAAMGGGVHLDLAHEIDYVLWLFGRPTKAKAIRRNVSTLEIDTVDYAHFTLEYPGFTACITLNYFRPIPKRDIEVAMDDTVWVANLIDCSIVDLTEGRDLYRDPSYSLSDSYLAQMSYFVNEYLDSEAPSLNDLNEGLAVLKIALTDE